jgi:hypothetical protein
MRLTCASRSDRPAGKPGDLLDRHRRLDPRLLRHQHTGQRRLFAPLGDARMSRTVNGRNTTSPSSPRREIARDFDVMLNLAPRQVVRCQCSSHGGMRSLMTVVLDLQPWRAEAGFLHGEVVFWRS